MTDRAVPNLPSRDLAATSAFYDGMGFRDLHRDDDWLLLSRGDLQIEFFRKDDHQPRGHDFAAACGSPICRACTPPCSRPAYPRIGTGSRLSDRSPPSRGASRWRRCSIPTGTSCG
jgi:catechol 2,3-dioxygenase-like lactoylglutathione lyase family enzyme